MSLYYTQKVSIKQHLYKNKRKSIDNGTIHVIIVLVAKMKQEKGGEILSEKPYYKFKAYLVENGIKQKDVAKTLGVTNATFNTKLNRNGSDFTMKQVRTLCREYGISADEFFLS